MDVGEVVEGLGYRRPLIIYFYWLLEFHIATIFWLVIWTRQNLSCFDFTVFPIVIVQPFGINNTSDCKFQVGIFMKIA